MAIHVHGIRHHGPGSARSLLRALEELCPDVVLIEGPPDADALLPLAAHEAMRPPLALLVYDPETPRRCAFYPFAEFSPEWQAIRFALAHSIPVRFMDLPMAHELAFQRKAEEEFKARLEAHLETSEKPEEKTSEPTEEPAKAGVEEIAELAEESAGEETKAGPEAEAEAESNNGNGSNEDLAAARRDPLSLLARAAGYDDGERWWEHLVEERRDPTGIFAAILEAMTVLRTELDGAPTSVPDVPATRTGSTPAPAEPDSREAMREAWMRQTIRAAEKEGFERIAVVCGAWHAPALASPSTSPQGRPDAKSLARQDAALLKGLPKIKTQSAWIPWTYGRLARDSGYGAGVISPGWYDFLWHAGGEPADGTPLAARWLARVAALLRGKEMDISTAHVIEAVRLAETLAALRGRPLAGLPELGDATLAVILNGEAAPLALIQRELIIGERLGEVPPEMPLIPLQQDLARLQKSLRLPPTADTKNYDLDLRKPGDLARSQLLHRLRLLAIPWGELTDSEVRSQGTFREAWVLQWQPEFAVALIEASVWGNTIESAATASAMHRATQARQLAELTRLIDAVLLADLPEAAAHVMARLDAEAAVASDVAQMMEALPPLAAVARYGNVRGTDAALIGRVVDGLVARIAIGLEGACASLDDAAAEAMLARLVAVDGALCTLENEGHLAQWRGALGRLAGRDGLHGLVAGRACRILLDAGALSPAEAGRRMGLALSRGADPLDAGAWIEGFLRGSGVLLLHTDALWQIMDGWVSALSAEAFTEVLPLLRRTFATFPAPERRMMGERVKREGGARGGVTLDALGLPPCEDETIDRVRAEKVLPLLELILRS